MKIPEAPFDHTITRYKICDLRREGVNVWMTAHDSEFLGFLKYTRAGSPRYRMRLDRAKSADLPDFFQPSLWRPIRPDLWGPLPEPADQTPPFEWPGFDNPEQEPLLPERDGWPYPHIRLGWPGEKPVSKEETEARILRALRTADALDPDIYGSEAAWPPILMIKAKVVAKMLRSSGSGKLANFRAQDYSDFHVDTSDLRPLPARFVPTRRDISDFDAGCLSWLSPVPGCDCTIFEMRSALPSFSFAQIAEADDTTADEIRDRYKHAIELAFQEATR